MGKIHHALTVQGLSANLNFCYIIGIPCKTSYSRSQKRHGIFRQEGIVRTSYVDSLPKIKEKGLTWFSYDIQAIVRNMGILYQFQPHIF